MRSDFEGREQENWDANARVERDSHREPYQRRGTLTAGPRASVGGQVQPPVKGGGR